MRYAGRRQPRLGNRTQNPAGGAYDGAVKKLLPLLAGLLLAVPTPAHAGPEESCMVINQATNLEVMVIAADAGARCSQMIAANSDLLYPTIRPPDTVLCAARKELDTGAWVQLVTGAAFGTETREAFCPNAGDGWTINALLTVGSQPIKAARTTI